LGRRLVKSLTRGFGILDESTQRRRILPACFSFDARRHIHSPRTNRGDCIGDVVGVQPAGENDVFVRRQRVGE